jgi:hypothetical protein
MKFLTFFKKVKFKYILNICRFRLYIFPLTLFYNVLIVQKFYLVFYLILLFYNSTTCFVYCADNVNPTNFLPGMGNLFRGTSLSGENISVPIEDLGEIIEYVTSEEEDISQFIINSSRGEQFSSDEENNYSFVASLGGYNIATEQVSFFRKFFMGDTDYMSHPHPYMRGGVLIGAIGSIFKISGFKFW